MIRAVESATRPYGKALLELLGEGLLELVLRKGVSPSPTYRRRTCAAFSGAGAVRRRVRHTCPTTITPRGAVRLPHCRIGQPMRRGGRATSTWLIPGRAISARMGGESTPWASATR